ncbi:VOC family protein [Clostridium diolis]|uniref:VOC family protein n=1 Tax=Clostridium diolis TaxID=223919 RepID=UPI003AF95562
MKIGVIGAGIISEIYLLNMIEKFDNIEVIAIADLNMDNAKKRAEQFGISACTMDELMKNPEIEMVVNLTPVGAHYSVIKDALTAGKHVYTEKTITNDSAKAAELLELADAKGLYLGSAPDTFLGSAIQTAKMAIEDKLLGEIHSFAISTNRNNDLLLSLFAFLRKPGTGVLLDFGVYYLTALVSLLGPVTRVGGIVGTPYKTHINILPVSPEFGQVMDTPNESQVSAIIQFKNGITGTLHIDTDSNMVDETYFAIYGTKGILYLPDPNQFGGEVKFIPNVMDPRQPVSPVTLWKFTAYDDNSRGIGPAEMAEAIENKRMNRTSKEMAYHVLEVLEAILQGGEKGRFIDILSEFEIPKALNQKEVPINNIGHITFQMKNEEEMIHFYTEVLGMKKLFTLTSSDLLETVKIQQGEEATEQLKKVINTDVEIPWIQYLKFSDHQYLELFHSLGAPYKEFGKREDYYGFKKVNYEVDDIEEVHKRLTDAKVEIKENIHISPDGAKEFSVLDPDGNEIQFTEYGENSVIPLSENSKHDVCSPFKYTTQVALQIHDEINMKNFYCRGLGLKKAYTMTYGDLAKWMENTGAADEQNLSLLRMMAAMPYIDYIEIAPHQYIEFFYCTGQKKKEERDLSKFYGYQHICLEVSDIHKAWDAVVNNGIKPDTEIALGVEGAYQFWLTDPDGNKIELMEYTSAAKHLL